MSEIALIGFVQTLFFSLLVLTKKGKETKDYFLVLFLLFVGAELAYRYLLEVISEYNNAWIAIFDIASWALFGPITLMYILFATNRVKVIRPVHLLHLVPLFLSLHAIMNYLTGNVNYNSFAEYFEGSGGLTTFEFYCWEFTSPVYIFYSFFILIIHKRSAKDYFSDARKKDLNWLLILISGFILIILFANFIWFLRDVLHFEIHFDFREVMPLFLTIYVFFFGFFGYRQQGIFFDYPGQSFMPRKDGTESADGKYEKSGLSDEERIRLIGKINVVMETEKLYMESDLNINRLAKRLDTSFHKLSQVINESFRKNFFDFVNGYRIRESKDLMKGPDIEKYTIISIAYICGFSSKSSFYNAFRKETGITPGEYIKSTGSAGTRVPDNGHR